MASVWPVTIAEARDERKRTAPTISAGSASRPIGVRSSMRRTSSGLSVMPRVSGVRTQVGGGLVRTRGQPFQLVLGGPDYAELAQWRDIMLAQMGNNAGLVGADSDYKETRPQMRVVIDKSRAADLDVSATAIGTALETMMGGRRVTTFVDNGEEYDVMLQADRDARRSVADLDALQVRAGNGSLVPLSNLVTLREIAEPGTYNRFNRLRSITLSARLAPGYPLGEAVEWAQQSVRDNLPDYAQVSWKGEARELQQK